MKVHFKYPRVLEGVTYAGGKEHNVPDALKAHWFLKGLVANGDAFITASPDESKEEKEDESTPATTQKRSK